MVRTKVAIPKNRAKQVLCAVAVVCLISACEANSGRTPSEIGTSGALLKTAVNEAEEATRRARIYSDAYIWDRADKELDSAQVILTKARDTRERIRRAYDAAVAVLAEMRPDAGAGSVKQGVAAARSHESELATAAHRVDLIGAALAAADRDVERIEQSIAALLDSDSPSRR